jgi:hypothetical protein
MPDIMVSLIVLVIIPQSKLMKLHGFKQEQCYYSQNVHSLVYTMKTKEWWQYLHRPILDLFRACYFISLIWLIGN